MKSISKFCLAAVASFTFTAYAQAEPVNTTSAKPIHIVIGHQRGASYAPIYLMEYNHLIELEAKKAGLDVVVEYKPFSNPDDIVLQMELGEVTYGALGGPSMIISNATNSDMDIRALGSIMVASVDLNTTEDVSSICDLKGSIGVPSASAIQSISTKIAGFHCGDAHMFDKQLTKISHAEGVKKMVEGTLANHFTSAPYQSQERQQSSRVHKLSSTRDIIGGRSTFIVLAGSEKFRQRNPVLQAAVIRALREADRIIHADPARIEAATAYVELDGTKETVQQAAAGLADPGIFYLTTPIGLAKFAHQMFQAGLVSRDIPWEDLVSESVNFRYGS